MQIQSEVVDAICLRKQEEVFAFYDSQPPNYLHYQQLRNLLIKLPI